MRNSKGQFKKGENSGEKNAFFGHAQSDDARRKMKEAWEIRKMTPISDETRKKMSESGKGRKFTEEHKKKIGKANKGRKIPDATKKKISQKIKEAWGKGLLNKGQHSQQGGEKNPNWKGGITPVHLSIRSCPRMKAWRMSVFERDGFACVWCGDDRGKNLEADHIISFSIILRNLKKEQGFENLFKKAMVYPPLWDLSNGRTLCETCHIKRHKIKN